MRIGHTPYGYRIENGVAVIDEGQAAQVRKLCEGYLGGLGLAEAARAAGLKLYHSSAMRMMLNRYYVGDDFYPAILTPEIQEAVEQERQRRSALLGRDEKPSVHKVAAAPETRFRMGKAAEHFPDPLMQAAYLYSLIEKGGIAWQQ